MSLYYARRNRDWDKQIKRTGAALWRRLLAAKHRQQEAGWDLARRLAAGEFDVASELHEDPVRELRQEDAR